MTSHTASSPPKRNHHSSNSINSSPQFQRRTQHSLQQQQQSPNNQFSHSSTRSVQSPNGQAISARAAARKSIIANSSSSSSSFSFSNPATNSANTPLTINDSDSGIEANNSDTQFMEDLKDRLAKAELAAEELVKNNRSLQTRLDKAYKDQAQQEEKSHEDEEIINELRNEVKTMSMQKRESEGIYVSQQAEMMKRNDAFVKKEEETQAIIQRLKDSLAQQKRENSPQIGGLDDDSMNLSRQGSPFAPPTPAPLSHPRYSSAKPDTLYHKDMIIQDLKLQVADLEMKNAELEHKDGGALQKLEKSLLEARLTNHRLKEENESFKEENESFQSLLLEKTLSGDFYRGKRGGPELGSFSQSSLADELSTLTEEDVNDGGEVGEVAEEASAVTETDQIRKLKSEVVNSKVEIKSLTLYLNRIIERILRYQNGFETILSCNDDDDDSVPCASAKSTRPSTRSGNVSKLSSPNKNKDLPAPPPVKETPSTENSSFTTPAQGLLQRARSMVGATIQKARPLTYIEPSPAALSLTEDPSTAPRIPLGRSQSSKRQSMILPRRIYTSGGIVDTHNYYNNHNNNIQNQPQGATTAAMVGSMVRPSEEGGGGGSMNSPGILSPRSSYFSLMHRNSGLRLASAFREEAALLQGQGQGKRDSNDVSVDDNDKDNDDDSAAAAARPESSKSSTTAATDTAKYRQSAFDALTGANRNSFEDENENENGDEIERVSTMDTPSPPQSLGATSSIMGGGERERGGDSSSQDNRQILTGNRIRPLKLVSDQQQQQQQNQQKKANRQSWIPNMGSWFNNNNAIGGIGTPPPSS